MREWPNMADFLLDQLFIYNKTNIAVISREYRFYFQATLYFRFTLLRYFWATNTNPDISVGIVVFPQVLPDYCILQYFNEYFPNIYCDISAALVDIWQGFGRGGGNFIKYLGKLGKKYHKILFTPLILRFSWINDARCLPFYYNTSV